MDKNEIATVLEDAARGYRDEKYGWCSGTWVEETDEARDDVTDNSSTLSACAEGALLFAAGFSWSQIDVYGSPDDVRYPRGDIHAAGRFSAARRALLEHVQAHPEEYAIRDGSSIPNWNDSLEREIYERKQPMNADIDERAQYWRDARVEAKNLVISAMEATAKDLRNG